MFSLSTVHTDNCTYSYENLLAVIPNFSPENIEQFTKYLKEKYVFEEDQLLQLLDYNHYEYDGAVFKDQKDLSVHLIIQSVECIGTPIL